MYSDLGEMPTAREIDSVASGNNSQLRADAVTNRHDKFSDLKFENHKRDALDKMEERHEAPEKQIWNDFVMLEDHELAHGYVAKYQRLCSQSELSASIHERFSARLESKRKLRISRRFSFVERQRRARERHQEYINKRRVRARKFIERREQVVQRAARTLEKRTKTFELRASRLDKRLLEQIEEDESPGRDEEKGKDDEEESVDVNDDVSVHLKRAEETLASKIEGIQANLKKKMESADERRRQLRAQERDRLAKALQQVEKVQEKKLLEEEEKSVKLQEKLEEAERRRKQLLEEESLRRKQKWEKREEVISREQELEEKKKKSLEERVELAIERKNRIIEETKLTIQKKLTDAEELLNRNRIEMEKKLQEMAERILQKQEKAEQLRIENLMRRKKNSSPSQLRSKSVSLASDGVSSPEPTAAVEGTVAG